MPQSTWFGSCDSFWFCSQKIDERNHNKLISPAAQPNSLLSWATDEKHLQVKPLRKPYNIQLLSILHLHTTDFSSKAHLDTELLLFYRGCTLRLLVFIICLTLLLGGILSPIPPYSPFPHSDKAMHLLGFGAVSLTARIAFIRTPDWLLWGILLIFAPLSEVLQYIFVHPLRSFSWLDILANLTGVVLAAISWWILTRIYTRWQIRKTK